MTHAPDRHVSPLVATAIVAVPPVFVWLLLRRGHSASTRRAWFFFAGVQALPGIISVIAGAGGAF